MSTLPAVNKVIIGIACPIYNDDAKKFFEAKPGYVKENDFDMGRYVWEWKYKETFVELYLHLDGKEDQRSRYNMCLICPHCDAELLLSVDNLKVILLYQFSENKVRHYIHYGGYKTNRLYLEATGKVDESAEKTYLSTNVYETMGAKSIPTNYYPEHPKIFSNDWKVKNIDAIERIEDLSDDEIAILLVTTPRHAAALLNDAKTGAEIAKRILKPKPENDFRTGRLIPETFELVSVVTPVIDGDSKSNLTIAWLYTYNNAVKELYQQIIIAGTFSFLLSLAIQFANFPINAILSLLWIPLIAVVILWTYWDYHKNVKRWQVMVKWLPENKHIKRANLIRNIYILTQAALLIIGLRGCI